MSDDKVVSAPSNLEMKLEENEGEGDHNKCSKIKTGKSLLNFNNDVNEKVLHFLLFLLMGAGANWVSFFSLYRYLWLL